MENIQAAFLVFIVVIMVINVAVYYLIKEEPKTLEERITNDIVQGMYIRGYNLLDHSPKINKRYKESDGYIVVCIHDRSGAGAKNVLEKFYVSTLEV